MAEARFLLDSNICIYVLADPGSPVAARLSECSPGCVVTSSVAYAEVLRGFSEEDRRSKPVQRFFQAVPVLPFDLSAAAAYARLPFRRARFDRLIAGHALSLGLTLVTNNERDFADVPDLTVENWSRR